MRTRRRSRCSRATLAAVRGAVLAAAALGAPAFPTPACAEPAETGTVAGVVRLLRAQPLLGLREVEDRSGVVVYVRGFTRPAPAAPALLHQRNERFEPRLLPIVAGQEVSFPNHDRIYHNVFSVSPLVPFDLGQYRSSDSPRSVRFEKTGLVPVFCNIHPQMISTVVVLENDAFATPGPDGRFEIRGVPAGDHELNAWAPGAQRVVTPIRVEPGGRSEVAIELRQTERIPPHRRKDGSDYPRPRYDGDAAGG